MLTQIMTTPILKGEEARKVLKELERVPSEKSKKGTEKLAKQFAKIEKENRR